MRLILGKFGYPINLITVFWIAWAIIILCMPTAIPVTATSMSICLEILLLMVGFASVVFAGFTTISTIWYFVWRRKDFGGPVMHISRSDVVLKGMHAKPINSNIGRDDEYEKNAL